MNFQKVYTATDVHIAGEVFRIIDDVPFVQYGSLKEFDEQLPSVFLEEMALLLNEPRGFAGINGCLVVPPFTESGDAAAVFFNHEGTLPIHYGGVIAVVTALLESGRLKEKTAGEYFIETVQGVIPVTAVKEKEQVVSARMALGECTVVKTDVPLLDASYTVVQADQRYALFDNKALGLKIELSELSALKKWGKNTLQELKTNPDIQGVILMDDEALAQGKIKTVTFRKDGWIVRSPGFGPTAACFASLLSRGGIEVDQTLLNESVYGSFLESKAHHDGKVQFAVNGRAFITGLQTFVLDPTDPLPKGFLIK